MASHGQTLTRRYLQILTTAKFVEDYRPPWLFGMEIDFFFPELNIGIEFNGGQHRYYTEKFGDFREQRWRDGRKKALAKEKGVRIIKLEAIDLIFGRLRCKLKPYLPLISKKHAKGLDKEATQYRAALRKMGCPTAHKTTSNERHRLADRTKKLDPKNERK